MVCRTCMMQLLLYSGMLESERQHRRRGVTVVLEERAASAWRMAGSEFTPVSERMLKIRLKSHFGHVSRICYRCICTNQ